MFGAIGKLVGGLAKKKFEGMKKQPGLLKGISDFKSWNQQRKNGPGSQVQGFGRGSSFGPPQGQPPGGGFQPPGGGPQALDGNFKRSPFPGMQPAQPAPPPQLGGGGMPGTGGAEPNPWATQPPQPPKPLGGQAPSLGGRGGFMPPDNGGAFGSYGRGWGG